MPAPEGFEAYPFGQDAPGVRWFSVTPSNTGAGPFVASLTCLSGALSVRRNGGEVAATTISGSYVAATVGGLGAFATISPSQFLPGSLYPVIAIKGTVSPEDLAILEAYIEWSMLP